MAEQGGNPQPHGMEPRNLDPATINRRRFIVTAAAAVATNVVLYRMFESSDKAGSDNGADAKGAYHSGDYVHYDDRLSRLVGEGLEENWKKVAVLPGMLVASPGAKFYKNANLSDEVDMGLKGANRLAILRPVFPGETFTLGAGIDYKGDDLKAIQSGGIDSDTFAFLSPQTGGVVYGNYHQSVENLDILTRIEGGELAYTSQTNSNLPLQFISIDKRTTDKDTDLILPAYQTGKHTERHYPKPNLSNPSHEENYYVYNQPASDGWYDVSTYVALAQGRLYTDAQSFGWMMNQFAQSDPVQVPDSYGPVHK